MSWLSIVENSSGTSLCVGPPFWKLKDHGQPQATRASGKAQGQASRQARLNSTSRSASMRGTMTHMVIPVCRWTCQSVCHLSKKLPAYSKNFYSFWIWGDFLIVRGATTLLSEFSDPAKSLNFVEGLMSLEILKMSDLIYSVSDLDIKSCWLCCLTKPQNQLHKIQQIGISAQSSWVDAMWHLTLSIASTWLRLIKYHLLTKFAYHPTIQCHLEEQL